ncbi:MAG: hypothetical protein HKN17_08390, partial [Rhodothermales bacterium]|nr:hypothetical protein [Rhodothermales bacterium]
MTRISAALLVLVLCSASAYGQSLQLVTPDFAGGFAYGLDSGDLDGDGDLDLVAAYRGGQAGMLNEWFLNDGNGTLTAGGTFPFYSDNSMSAAIADFDQDGRMDVVFANAYANNFNCTTDPCDENVVYLNTGNQTTANIADFSATSSWTDGFADGSWDVEAGDLNGDGVPDFVVANTSGTASRIWLNDNVGAGSVSFTASSVPGASVFASGVTIADFNADGYNDIAFSNGTVLLSTTASGAFNGFVRPSPDLTGTFNRVESGDLDGDGDVDLVFVGNYSVNRVYLNDGTGAFSAGMTFGPSDNPRFESDLADIDDDGNLDIVAAGFQIGGTPFDYFQLGAGDGTFSLGSVAGFSGRLAVELADMNGDGYPDVVTSDPSRVWLNTSGASNLIVTNTDDSGPGSLRAAVDFANGSAAPSEQITFDIPGAGPHVIALQSELLISDPVVLDGLSQSGAVCGADVGSHDLRVVLDGSLAPAGGLRVAAGGTGSTIQGFVINDFPGVAVTLAGASGNTVRCNYLGTDPTGSVVEEIGSTAIQVSSGSGNVIGGPTPADGNLISGFAGVAGVAVSASSGTIVRNNVIGLTADASALLRPSATGLVGISTFGSSTTEIVENVIGGFPLFGVELQAENDSEIRGNFIGTNANGDAGLGNAIGILLQKETNGSLVESNTIANNAGDGIVVISGRDQSAAYTGESTGNTITANAFRDNGGIGIDLGATVTCDPGTTTNCSGGLWPSADGPTPNDPGDGDTGSNTLINYPEIVRAELNSVDDLIVTYRVDTDGLSPLSVEFFLADASGQEGALLVGTDAYSDPAGGLVSVSYPSASAFGLTLGDFVVASLTDAAGNSSEFSPGAEVVESGTFIVTQAGTDGAGSLREALTLANMASWEPSGADVILFDIPGAGPHVITPTSALPVITDAVLIDGTSQAGATCGTADMSDRDLRIVLDGSALSWSSIGPNADGLTIGANTDDFAIRGLVINGFPGSGIFVGSGNSNGVIQCNIIGTDISGLVAAGNYSAGVQIVGFGSTSDGNLVGGPAAQDGNLIAANGYDEIHLEPGADSNEFRNNLIGTDITGDAVLQTPANYFGAPSIDTFSNLTGIGLNQAGFNLFADNVIGGFTAGMELVSSGDGETFAGGFNTVVANFIGTDRTGATNLSNGTGILIQGSGLGTETVGGTTPSDGNVIRFNGTGIRVAGAPDHYIGFNSIDQNAAAGISMDDPGSAPYASATISSNSMSDNGGLGIDLGANGFTPNDAGDVDDGPNGYANFPTLTSARLSGGGAALDVGLAIDTSFPVTVEIFAADPDREEGAVLIGSEILAAGPSTRTVSIPAPAVSAGDFIVATA